MYIAPPERAILTDSAGEDEGGLIDNSSERQLLYNAEHFSDSTVISSVHIRMLIIFLNPLEVLLKKCKTISMILELTPISKTVQQIQDMCFNNSINNNVFREKQKV